MACVENPVDPDDYVLLGKIDVGSSTLTITPNDPVCGQVILINRYSPPVDDDKKYLELCDIEVHGYC